jgi:hypothetical protein
LTLTEPTRLVELDIDRRVFPVEPVEIGQRPAGFVSAERDRTLQPRQRVICVGRQRLLYQFDPQIDEHRHVFAKLRGIPALARIDDEPRRRRRLPHRPHPFDVAVAPQFQFEQRPSAIGGRQLSHRVRCIEADRERRHDRRHRAEPGQLRYAAISALRIEVPECAVESIARRARRQRMLQCIAVEAREHRAFHRINRGDDAVDALAVPLKRHAFAAAASLAVGNFGDHDVDRGRDPMHGHQRSRERPRTAGDG